MKFLNCEGTTELWAGIKEALSKKQDKLVGAREQIIGFNERGDPVPCNMADFKWIGAQCSNENLLDNWYFPQVINQNNSRTTETEELSAYFTDRWLLGRSKVTFSTEGIAYTTPEAQSRNGYVQQRVEKGRIKSEKITASFLTAKGLYSYTSVLPGVGQDYQSPYRDSLAISIIGLEGYYSISLRMSPAQAITVRAAKLELGSEQTLARQNELGEWELVEGPPDGAAELLKCQRYQVVYGGEKGMPLLAPGYAAGTATAVFLLDLPTAMRAAPAVRFSSLYVGCSGARIPVTAAAVIGAPAQNKLAIQATCSGANFAGNEPCFLTGEGAYQLVLDANL